MSISEAYHTIGNVSNFPVIRFSFWIWWQVSTCSTYNKSVFR